MSLIPKSVGIIIDGNRRWAQYNNLPSIEGHRKGAQNLKKIVVRAIKLGIQELNIFGLSSENWSRGTTEISYLLSLIERYIRSEITEMHINNIVFNIVGDKNKFNKSLNNLMVNAENITKNNTGMKFNLALNYGGKMDFIYTCKSIVEKVQKNEILLNDINENTIKNNLLSNKVSEIDLLIRTSGEYRISNFMLWQLAYSEMYFTKTLWPDFWEDEFEKAIDCFAQRNRRYGSNIDKNSKIEKK